jgi:lipopolysaccharide/colanic/teichoic acid biosynthesis glycosyltransferase
MQQKGEPMWRANDIEELNLSSKDWSQTLEEDQPSWHKPRPDESRPSLLHNEWLTRGVDIVVATTILVLVFPVIVLLAIVLQLDSPGKLIFAHPRVGRGGKMFICYKFRTMCENAPQVLTRYLAECEEARLEWARDYKLRNDPRITRLGKWVRKLSLDEFPQLVNIIRGEMSIVGPRPIVEHEASRYGPYFADYCAVKPGLTGLWQVSGRNDMSYDDRVALDRFYVLRKSFLFDLSIIARTVPSVLAARGSY